MAVAFGVQRVDVSPDTDSISLQQQYQSAAPRVQTRVHKGQTAGGNVALNQLLAAAQAAAALARECAGGEVANSGRAHDGLVFVL
jgi:hypothetical protein